MSGIKQKKEGRQGGREGRRKAGNILKTALFISAVEYSLDAEIFGSYPSEADSNQNKCHIILQTMDSPLMGYG